MPQSTLVIGFLLTHFSESKPGRTLKEWIAAFIENDEEEEAYRAQMYKRAEEEDDLLSGGSDRHHIDDRHEDGYYDDLDLDIDESVLEGLIIVALAATLLVLVYMRQQRNRQRQNGNVGANPGAPGDGNEDRGFFPRPGDPEFAQWVAGGVGH